MNAQKDFMSGIPLLVCLRTAGRRAKHAEAACYPGNVHHPPPAKKILKIAE